jgi:epoxyqueuosine reductase
MQDPLKNCSVSSHGFNGLKSVESIKSVAYSLGFDLVGIAPVGPFRETNFYSEWLERGYAGEMKYLERQKPARLQPESLLPGARSVIVCAMNYNTAQPYTRFDRVCAWISRYAWGLDYHETLKKKLHELAAWIEQNADHHTKCYVDTGPLVERVYAKYAGIGWFGKNTCIINQKIGSWLFLGCIITDLELKYDVSVADRCGTCTRCIDACPTSAILEPYVLDSRKCISYTTIELRGSIPEEDRAGIGHHLFGCDICQDVCPWNRKAPASSNAAFEANPGLLWPAIETLLDLKDEDWSRLIRGTAMKRAKVRGLLRNLMVVAGNSGLRVFLPRLRSFLTHDDDHVRSHAQWAIEKITAAAGEKALFDPAAPSGVQL